MCLDCIVSFMNNPLHKLVIFISFFLAITLLVIFIIRRNKLSNKSKLGILYGFIFFLVLPIAFYLYARTCQTTFLSCNAIQSIIYSLLVTAIASSVISFLFIPFIYGFSSKSKQIEKDNAIFKIVEKYANKLGIKTPRLYVIDKAVPTAFSISHIKPSIFLTVVLLELLNSEESGAVLLHELGHLKQKSSLLKFTNSLFRLFSPLSNFNVLHQELNQEERDADKVAIEIQKTDKYLISAKQKIADYHRKKAQ